MRSTKHSCRHGRSAGALSPIICSRIRPLNMPGYSQRRASARLTNQRGKLTRPARKPTYQTEPTTLMKLSPAVSAVTWLEEVPVVMEVTVVERGTVIMGSAWLRARAAVQTGCVKRAEGWSPICGELGAEEGGVRVELWVPGGCGADEGVLLVGEGGDGLRVPDPARWEK